jgi:hypothetical protein
MPEGEEAKKMEIRKIPINDINPAPYNPRKDLKPGDSEYEKLKRSIDEFDLVEPLVWNEETGNLVGGHQRLKILVDRGDTEVEVSVVHLDSEKEKALNIALNKIQGDWDYDKLGELLEELSLSDIDINLTGFDNDEIAKLNIELDKYLVSEDEYDIDEREQEITPTVKSGEIYLLGRHRLMCGDAASNDDIGKLMAGAKANMCVTDPPYNIDYTGKTKDELKIKNDKMDDEQFYNFILCSFKNIYNLLDDGGAIYVFHADAEGLTFRRAFIEAGFHLANVCVWVKNSMVMGRSDYQWQHEPILYGWKPTAPHNWYSDRKQTTIWNFDRPTRSIEHPTMKPVSILSYAIKNSSLPNHIIFDGFGGQWVNAHCLRGNKQNMLYDGIRPEIL